VKPTGQRACNVYSAQSDKSALQRAVTVVRRDLTTDSVRSWINQASNLEPGGPGTCNQIFMRGKRGPKKLKHCSKGRTARTRCRSGWQGEDDAGL
jgi:hypothetical protein